MAGDLVRYDIGIVEWEFTRESGDPETHFDLLWGTTSGNYPNTKTYLATDPRSDQLYNVVPGLGQYYAVMRARNAYGDGSQSAEVPFVVVAGPISMAVDGGTLIHVGTTVQFIWRANWLRLRR